MGNPSKTFRLPFRKIAVTVPPSSWFHGISHALFEIYRRELVELGLEVFDVPVDAFLLPDVSRIASLISDLRTFRPELAFGLHKGAYALLCRMPARRDGWRANLFTDVLDIPTVCLWDHAPLELADQLLAPHPARPEASTGDARETIARSLTHPRLLHWSPDTGQTRIMKELGFILPDRVIEESLPALPGFRYRQPADGPPSVAFVGHFYQQPRDVPHPVLGELAERTIQTWLRMTSRPLFNVLRDQIDALDPELRRSLALDLDQSWFWRFAHRLVLHDAQTALRLKVLGSAGTPVTCYGDLNTELPGVPRNLHAVPEHIPYGPELATCLARHTLTIDVFNPGSIDGFSHKPMITFASGGFMLVNAKRDFIAAFGDTGRAVSYQPGTDELAAKIDHFLTNPAYLRETGNAIREIISRQFQLKDVLARVVEAAFRCAGPVRSGSVCAQRTLPIENVLPAIRSDDTWIDASVEQTDGACVVIAPHPWAYAAQIPIPASVGSILEPHLRMIILVESGRIGVAALLDTGMLADEQHASAGPHAVTLTVELPREGSPAVILRNSAEIPTRVRVLEATLCERAPRRD